jgi:hypothetical protein
LIASGQVGVAEYFTGYRLQTESPEQQGTTTITMGATVYVGLALTSHSNSSSCVGTFDNVRAPGWSPWQGSAPAGLTAVPVSTSEINLS